MGGGGPGAPRRSLAHGPSGAWPLDGRAAPADKAPAMPYLIMFMVMILAAMLVSCVLAI
ncbi:hypothetical protein LPC08_09830 [Roseomonas sp. OT10]|uniref:hypothetical protein n=1 Tax=Roseomonas cutis TaxID=2897332 RepID=UPI001E552C74|nr:hypothetical protein [Roseomonas sp. OT10]UFN50880.1 hypothetical protein LPC08_09830 [Roseomonas sp. OT10]